MSAWNRFCQHVCSVPSLGLSLDISRMRFDDTFLGEMEGPMSAALSAMEALEGGAIANPDEHRMVGHYWLRNADQAPTRELASEIQQTVAEVKAFAGAVHAGQVKPPQAERFTEVLSIGIGGSALGPMFVSDALGDPRQDRMTVRFIDNTDPDGIARELARLEGKLAQTLVLVISKSGGTPETRNGMLEVAAAFREAGLDFGKQAVAVTGVDSKLDKQAVAEGWLKRFPMWDWVGGRTSEMSVVGLLPAALQGLDIDAMLVGAADCDEVTRRREMRQNPAALMALMWYAGGEGRGSKDLVVLPYKDRLLLFSRYLQQLIMESLGKRLDLAGRRVEQGLAVYGNKGSTDQHAYVQQLRDGVANFFVTFVRVLEDGGQSREVDEGGVTSGDYLHGFWLGTRSALADNGRGSMTLTIRRVDARSVGVLIALFERAVGLYASLVGINAYHQPGVEAGKKAAAVVLEIQKKLVKALGSEPHTAVELAEAIGELGRLETVYFLLEHLEANGRARKVSGEEPATAAFARV